MPDESITPRTENPMQHSVLDRLKQDDFVVRFAIIPRPVLLHSALQRSKEVQEVRNALRDGVITDTSIRDFVSDLLRDYRYGVLFPHEMALAALAVALQERATTLADEFICDLATLDLRELSLAAAIARIALARQRLIAGNQSRLVVVESVPSNAWLPAPSGPRVVVGDSHASFAVGAA